MKVKTARRFISRNIHKYIALDPKFMNNHFAKRYRTCYKITLDDRRKKGAKNENT